MSVREEVGEAGDFPLSFDPGGGEVREMSERFWGSSLGVSSMEMEGTSGLGSLGLGAVDLTGLALMV